MVVARRVAYAWLMVSITATFIALGGCALFGRRAELTLQTVARGAAPLAANRALPPNDDESTVVVTFVASRLEVYASEVRSGVIGESLHLYQQEQGEIGPRPVLFGEAPIPLNDLNVGGLPSSVGIVYVWTSAFFLYNGNEWYGKTFGSDASGAGIDTARWLDDLGHYVLDDLNFYVDPTTSEVVEFVEYHVVFIDSAELGFSDRSCLLHYHKVSGHDDNDFTNDVWEFGSLNDSTSRGTAVVSLLSGSPYEFGGAESGSTRDVYVLVVPMDRIDLSRGGEIVVTIAVELENLIDRIYTGENVTDPAAVRYVLDSSQAPVTFNVSIEYLRRRG